MPDSLLQYLQKAIHFPVSVVDVEAHPDGPVHAHPLSQRIGTVATGTDGDTLINIEKLFGITATKHGEQIELVIELVTPEECTDDRVGLKDETYTILDVAVPYKRVPVSPGRNLTPIVEVAARDYLLKRSGYHAAKEFEEELLMTLKKRESNEK